MSKDALLRFGERLLSNQAQQREFQTVINDLAAAIVDAGKRQGCEFTVQELGEFLNETFFPDGSTPERPVNDKKQWAPVFRGFLQQIKVSNPNHQMFQTMSLDTMEAEEKDALEDLLRAAAAKKEGGRTGAAPASADAPAGPWGTPAPPSDEPQEEAFEPDESYMLQLDDETARKLAAAEERLKQMEGHLENSSSNSSWWKIW